MGFDWVFMVVEWDLMGFYGGFMGFVVIGGFHKWWNCVVKILFYG